MVDLKDAKIAAEKEYKEEPMDSLYDNLFAGFLSRRRVDKIIRYLHNKDVILDVGCESGYASILFSHNVKQVYAIDIVKEAIEEFEQKLDEYADVTNITVNIGSAHKIDMPSNSVDVVVCTEVIEHMPQLDIGLKEMSRVLKTGGKLILTFPNEDLRKFLYPIAKLFGVNTDIENEVTLFKYNRKDIKPMLKRYNIKRSFGFPWFFPVTNFIVARKI